MKQQVEGPFGLKMSSEKATRIDALLKTLPRECRELKRKATAATSVELIPGEMADISKISVETVDRQGEVILVKGISRDQFEQNSVVTWCHKYDDPPLGYSQWVKPVGNALVAKTVYSKTYDFAQTIYKLTQEGIVKGKSIGFLPTHIRAPDKTEPQWKDASAVIDESILLEYACCGLPVNQESLVQFVAKGLIDDATIKRLGLGLPTKKKHIVSDAEVMLKALNTFQIDPNKIMAQVIHNLTDRGKV